VTNPGARAAALLAGPRGRRLCLALALDAADRSWPPLPWVGRTPVPSDPDDVRRSLAGAVAALDLAEVAGTAEPSAFLGALLGSVDWAWYWQEPDDADRLLSDAALAAALEPVADAAVRAPAARWWSEPVARAAQHAVEWPVDPPEDRRPALTGAPAALRRWRQETLADERRSARERPVDVTAAWSGSWWSTPALSGLVATTRSLPGPSTGGVPRQPVDTPVGLVLVEDSMGWETARTWPLEPAPAARVYEVTGPAAWTALVERYPLDVSASRRHDWWRAAGWDGAWAVPDWAAVAADHDAVHLTVAGYLATAGRALPVEVPGSAREVRTLLAGWDPDATWWLADVLRSPGNPVQWRRPGTDDQVGWTVAG
jgi:hypothetical protein